MSSVDDTQKAAARVAGASYLLAIPFALFSEFYVPTQLVAPSDAATTARAIIEHQTLFRAGLASNLIVFAIDTVLITALYIALAPVRRSLALTALLWRVVETALLVTVITINDANALRMLGTAPYLRAIGDEQLQALALASIGGHNAGYNVGLFFAGLGSTLFCYLWMKSGYVPKLLAAFGVFASAILAVCTLAFVVFPAFAQTATIAVYGGPILLFELSMGFWLLVKGIRVSPTVQPA